MIIVKEFYLFPIVVLAFMGPSVAYLSAVLTFQVRWAVLILLFVAVLFNKRKGVPRNKLVIALLIVSGTWGLTTAFWSQNFDLSVMKSGAFLVCSVPLVLAGHKWVDTNGIVNSFNYLTPVAMVSIAAAIFGYFFSPFAYSGDFFQGFVYGPNMMGALLAVSTSFTLWQAWRFWLVSRWRIFWVLTVFLCFGGIYITQSRSALLMAVCSFAGMCQAFSKRKSISIGFLIVMLVVLVVALRPDLQDKVVQQVVYKHSEDVFYTRIQPWSESLQKAQLGGLVGGGFGVSIGADNWGGGLTSVGYGREKGNSQLAIIEETGLIGFAFYLAQVFFIIKRVYVGFATSVNPQAKVALGLAFGTLIGLLLQSCVEAWWLAPGAPEFVAFWALVGVSLGLCTKNNEKEVADV